MEKQLTLVEIVREMELVSEDDDPETAHPKADDLLVQALIFLQKHTLHSKEIEELLTHYMSVRKWYA